MKWGQGTEYGVRNGERREKRYLKRDLEHGYLWIGGSLALDGVALSPTGFASVFEEGERKKKNEKFVGGELCYRALSIQNFYGQSQPMSVRVSCISI
jgi:hypothetical protein